MMPMFTSEQPGLPGNVQRQLQLGSRRVQLRRRRVALLWSYLPDWILCIGLTGCFYMLDYIDGFMREFDLNDTSIQHSFTVHERIPNSLLLVLAGAAPLVILPITNFFTIKSWWDWHNSTLGLLLSLSLTGAVSQVVKVCVGRPRPDLIARCLPKPGSVNAATFGLVTSTICTQTDAFILRDGFRSFPSAHSSLSFAGLGFLSFYLSGKLHLFDERGYTGKAWVALTPFTGAALIAISRTMDYRHHWQDVTTGSILGIVLAFFSYRQYFPSLQSPLSHRPYSPRIPSEKAVIVDEEHGIRASFDVSTEGDHDSEGSTVQLHTPKPNPRGGYRGENIEMEATSIDDTVRRPRQSLDEVWRTGDDPSGTVRRP